MHTDLSTELFTVPTDLIAAERLYDDLALWLEDEEEALEDYLAGGSSVLVELSRRTVAHLALRLDLIQATHPALIPGPPIAGLLLTFAPFAAEED